MKKTSIKTISAGTDKLTIQVPLELRSVTPNAKLLSQYVRVLLKNKRSGNASTKDRSQIVGTTKKMYKQKGTGNARHASAKAPIFVGGGVAGGPKPRDYSVKMNKKQKNQALDMAIASRIDSDSLLVISKSLVSEAKPKTKFFIDILEAQGIKKGTKFTLVYEANADKSIYLAARNISGSNTVSLSNVNAYEVLKGKVIIFTQEAFSRIYNKV